MVHFSSLLDLMDYFPKGDEAKCIEHLEAVYWADGVKSPFAEASKVYKCKNGRYRCKVSGKYFNVRTGTMFDNTKISLRKWFMAIWLLNNQKKGITSVDLAKHLMVTQRTAWFILHRIRNCHKVENNNELFGTIEIDESLVGGLDHNRHVRNRSAKTGAENYGKSWVFGMLERGGKVNIWSVANRDEPTLVPLIKKYIRKGSRVITDQLTSYQHVGQTYAHTALNHKAYEFVNRHDGGLHNNSIESTWCAMKNSLQRMYNHVSDKHLQRYLDEFCYRFNLRDLESSDKFHWLLANAGVRTKYKDLIAA